ncbi:CIA30 family protein [Massilia sp. NR 4-1]|uniref:CIA30 family protein n=1 Tax=Massilia sp. NR 4-1 TaxID=1678028 RepID=UPI00067ABBDC|nr:CIA30 family protein [Massilia sp. NR 4-1]AKU23930.1 amidohydrolase [Massilia sp. NR 4-1]
MAIQKIRAALLAAGLATVWPALADTWLIRDVRVFDGERVHARRSVLLEDGKIRDADFKGKPPAAAKLVEGKGRTLLPGLIDSHVHAYRHLDLPLLFGVTTQVDMFTAVPLMREVSERMAKGENQGQADLFSAGTLATVPGGHGTEYGLPIPTLTTPGEAQAWVDARLAEGSYFIKIVMEPGSAAHKIPSLDLPTVKALIEAAHLRGKLAVVHIGNLDDARAALEAGADGLVHLFDGAAIAAADLEAFVRLARERKAFIVPTFSVLESIAGLREDDVLADAGLTSLLKKEQLLALQGSYGKTPKPEEMTAPRAVTAALHKAGVPLLAGTDAGNTGTQYGVSLHHELRALVQAGLTPQAALAAATSVPAQAFRLPQRGRIANGYKADLLLVEGDPTQDIQATRRIVEVWKDGAPAFALRKAQQEKVALEAGGKVGGEAVALPADGRISLFGKDKLASPFGAGWMPSTDSFLGGKSSVRLQHQEGDAVRVNASVVQGFAYPWAGLAFMTGAQAGQAANLSAAKVLRFRVRGDGKNYGVSLLAEGVQIPVNRGFTAAAEWQEVSMNLADFKGIDARLLTMIAFNAGPVPGDYQFEIADVCLLDK